jgi:methyltransferase family protein
VPGKRTRPRTPSPIRDTAAFVADLPFVLDRSLAERLAPHLDQEGKVLRVLDELGPLTGSEVALLDGGPWEADLRQRAASLSVVPSTGSLALPSQSVDAVVSLWSAFRGADRDEVAEAERVLRPGGRLLAVHDYGRDDVSRLRPADLPEYGAWSRRDGPFLGAGWKVRVVHAWWTFESVDEAAAFLGEVFGGDGESLAATLHRPRLSYNIAIYHRAKEAAAG